MWRLICFFLLTLSLFARASFANSESEIRTPDGHDPYLIVVSDDSGGSKREPGIYGRTKQGRWRLLVRGNAVGGKTTSGVLTFLDLTKLDSRYETMVVMNGKPYIFHVNAKPNDRETILEIGGENAGVHDLFYTQRVIQLPTIKSVDDVSLFQLPIDEFRREQAILVSMKMEQPAFDGSKGVTLLFVLKAGRATSKKIELVRDPVVVDYRYYSSGDLRSLIINAGSQKRGFRLISRLLFEHFAQSKPSDSPEITKWRQKLASTVSGLKGRFNVSKLPKSYPYLDISTGGILVTQRLSAEVQVTSGTELLQIYDPITGERGLNPSDRNTMSPFDFVGEIDRDTKGKFLMYPAQEIEDARLVYLNGELLFFLDMSGSHQTSGLLRFKVFDATIPHADQLAFHVITSLEDYEDEADEELLPAVVKNKSTGEEEVFHLLLSVKSGKKSRTEVFILKPDFDSNTLQVLKREKIGDTFYTDEELKYRVHVAYGAVLFDETTPRKKSQAAYDQMRDETAPHLDVARSTAKERVYGYLKAQEGVPVINDVLDYFVFNAKGAKTNLTGLYFKRPLVGGVSSYFPGELLVPDWVRDVFDVQRFLFAQEVTLSSGTKGHLIAIAIDKGYEKGRSSFSVLLLFMYQDTQRTFGSQKKQQEGEEDDEEALSDDEGIARGTEKILLLDEIKFQMPVSALQTVQAFTGKKKGSSGQVSILFSVEGSSRKHLPGVYAYSYLLEGGGKQLLEATSLSRGVRLSENSVVASEMVVRFFLDEAGTLYWVRDPQKPTKDSDFALIRLQDGSTILLNSPTGRALALLPFLDFEKGGEPGAGSFSMDRYSAATWRVWNEWTVDKKIDRFDELEKALKGKVKKREEEETDEEEEEESEEDEPKQKLEPVRQDPKARQNVHARMAEYYPNLTTFLHELADPKISPQHRILLVPEDQREHLLGYILKLWVEGYALKGNLLPPTFSWVRENNNLKLYVLDPTKAGQDDFWENFRDMDKQKKTDRAVVVVDMNDLAALGRPVMRDCEDAPFKFGEVIADDGKTLVKGEALPPHASYLLATEGQRFSLQEFQKRAASKNVSILLVGSRRNLEKIMHDSQAEGRAGLWSQKHFDPPVSYYHGDWRLWGPHTSQVSRVVRDVVSHGVGKYREKIFGDLERMMLDLANPDVSPKHQLLIVPPEVKDFVHSMLIARWSDEKLSSEPWHFKNPALRVFMLSAEVRTEGARPKKAKGGSSPQEAGQEHIFENLDIIGALSGGQQRVVLLADLEKVIQLGRAQPSSTQYGAFELADMAVAVSGEEAALDVAPAEIEMQTFFPHVLYLLDTEGERIPLKEFSKKGPRKIPMLLIGTPEELERLQRDVAMENRYGLLDHFEVVHLSLPDHTVRRAMLKQALSRTEIRSLEYAFDSRTPEVSGEMRAEGMSLEPEKSQDELLAYMVSYCERLATQNKMNVLTAFLKMFQAFNVALIRDEILRTEKIVDRRFVQRLMASPFRVQLNPSLLSEDDPLVLIQDEQDIALRVEAAGYKGPFDLTSQTVRILARQSEPNSKLPIPASLLVFGESGSGKTSLVLALIKVFNLLQYDFKNPKHPGAQAFVLNCRKLVEREVKAKAAEGEMTVEDAFRHLDHFLTLPHGARGVILFDDIHAPVDTIRSKLLAKIQTLVGSEDGMWRGVSAFAQGPDRGEVREIPLQNVMLFATGNPTYDQERLKRFQKDKTRPPTTEELILASLSTADQQLDLSFLLRWGGILRLDNFDSDAKVPAVLAEARAGAQNVFTNQNRVVLVSPESAELLRQRFPGANARTFLAQTSPALLATSSRVHGSTPLHIIVPKDVRFQVGGDDDSSLETEEIDPDEEDGQVDGERRNLLIETFIQEHIQALPVLDSYEGNLELLKLMVGSFRSYLLENMVKALRRDMRFAKDPTTQYLSLAPILHAIHAHVWLHPTLNLAQLNLDPREFGATNRSLEDKFRQALERRDTVPSHPFIKWIFTQTRRGQLWSLMEGDTSGLTVTRSRRDVLVETEQVLRRGALSFLERIIGIGSIERLPDSQAWVSHLQPADPEVLEEAVKQVGTFYLEFLTRLYDAGLLENERPTEYASMTTYDAARLFLMTLDRALARLPWAKVEGFVAQSLLKAANDLSLGELPGFQDYVFKSPHSILVPRTIDLPLQIASSSDVFREWAKTEGDSKDDKPRRLATRFLDECERMFQRPGGSP